MSQMGRGAGTLGGQFHFRVLFHEHSTTTIPSLSVNIELRIWCFWVFEGLEINTEHQFLRHFNLSLDLCLGKAKA